MLYDNTGMKLGALKTFILGPLILGNAKDGNLALDHSTFTVENVEQEDLVLNVRRLSMHFYYAVNATARTIAKV